MSETSTAGPAVSTHSVIVKGIGPVEVTAAGTGAGRPFLLLHGGGGPQTVAGFAALLAADKPARVITPTHPGFGGTPRPQTLHTVRGLAEVYVALLAELGLTGVTVVGNSIGGWIAAELAALNPASVSGVVIVDAVGIEVPGHPVADFFSLTMDQVAELSYHDPAAFRIDVDAMPPAQREIMAANRAAISVYAGTAMTDPTLTARLGTITLRTLVLWGDSDRIADPDYGRAFASAIPGARFHLLTATGHLPQLETPDQFLSAVWDFATTQPA